MSSGGLSQKQERAAMLLSEGMPRAAVAFEVEVNPKTIFEWLKIPEFNEYVDDLLAEAKERTKVKLYSAGNDAVQALQSIANDRGQPTGHRIDAAARIIEFILNRTETTNIKDTGLPKPGRKELLKIANRAHKEAYGLYDGGNESQ